MRNPSSELGGRNHRHLAGRLVDQLDLDERLDDLLPVRADVLHRRGADRAGDPRHRLDAGESLADRVRDQRVPVVARLHAQPDETRPGRRHPLDPLGVHAHDGPVEGLVADEEVGSAAEDEPRIAVRPHRAKGVDELRRT